MRLSGAPVAGGRDLAVPGDGTRLAATRWPGTGTPVLLLHGLASQRRFFNPLAARLAGLPVVALDARGHGGSEAPDEGYDVATSVRDVTVALDALGVSRVVVVGHSWGAAVATALAAEHPERVLAVVAVDGGLTTPRTRWTREEAREALAPPELAVPPEELPAVLRGGPLAPWWRAEVEESVLPIFAVGPDGLARARLAREHHLALIDAMWEYDPDALLPRVGVPYWAVVATPLGEDDDWSRAKREGVERAVRLLARPRVVTLGGGVHDVPLQWPALVAGVVRAAVEELLPGTPSGGDG